MRAIPAHVCFFGYFVLVAMRGSEWGFVTLGHLGLGTSGADTGCTAPPANLATHRKNLGAKRLRRTACEFEDCIIDRKDGCVLLRFRLSPCREAYESQVCKMSLGGWLFQASHVVRVGPVFPATYFDQLSFHPLWLDSTLRCLDLGQLDITTESVA